MKYTKEFVDLCSNWIRGSITDKYSGIKQHIDIDKIDDIQRWISPYLDKFRIITRWENSIYFDIYKVLEYGINEYNNENKEYSKNDFETYTTRLKNIQINKRCCI